MNKREKVLYLFAIIVCLEDEEFEELTQLLESFSNENKWGHILIEKAKKKRG